MKRIRNFMKDEKGAGSIEIIFFLTFFVIISGFLFYFITVEENDNVDELHPLGALVYELKYPDKEELDKVENDGNKKDEIHYVE